MLQVVEQMRHHLPLKVQERLDRWMETAGIFTGMQNPKVLGSMASSAVRGLVLRSGKHQHQTLMPCSHEALFNWDYGHDHPEMLRLYERAKEAQWNGSNLPWQTSVDPLNPERILVPLDLLDLDDARGLGIILKGDEPMRMVHSMASWLLSQFLHGEQGALMASAQVTEAVPFMDGKYYGATQVMDEARHVEVFYRYLREKAGKMYQINDNLFVIIDALISDSRWDIKFLGMQIMVEGLALGAFGFMYQSTQEPLLKELLKYGIQDEARHVQYGVLALQHHVHNELSEAERAEREDWAFEVALLMRNRFLAYEVYEEWFAGTRVTRANWRDLVTRSPGMHRFRKIMFTRLVPNLREIGLLSERIRPAYVQAGLGLFFNGKSATELSGEQMLRELDQQAI